LYLRERKWQLQEGAKKKKKLLHNKDLYNLYASQNIIRAIKSQTMR